MLNQFLGSNDPRVKVDTGTAVKALLINILYGGNHWFMLLRRSVILIARFYSERYIKFCLNDDYLGKALEELGSNDSANYTPRYA